MSGEPEYLNIIGIQKATEGTTYADDNNKIMTSGRILQEIDNANIENTYNYVVEDLTYEVTTEPSEAIESDPLYKYYTHDSVHDLYKKSGTSGSYSYLQIEAAAEAPYYLFVYTSGNNPYYTLYEKNTETSPFIYIVCRTNTSSIVLEQQHQDLYTLYDTDYPDPETPITLPVQTWIETIRFSEDLQINLTHTQTSLTTKGDILVLLIIIVVMKKSN